MSSNGVIRRGAYSGVLFLILAIPLVVLGLLNKHRSYRRYYILIRSKGQEDGVRQGKGNPP